MVKTLPSEVQKLIFQFAGTPHGFRAEDATAFFKKHRCDCPNCRMYDESYSPTWDKLYLHLLDEWFHQWNDPSQKTICGLRKNAMIVRCMGKERIIRHINFCKRSQYIWYINANDPSRREIIIDNRKRHGIGAGIVIRKCIKKSQSET